MSAGGAELEPGDLHLRLDAVAASVPEARSRLREWCDGARIAGCTRSDLLLAVTEVASNVVLHAYPEGRPGAFSLDAHRAAGEVVVSIRDEGLGRAGAAPSRGGGLGLGIVAGLFPGFTVSDADPGTRVTIRAQIEQA